MKIIVSGGGTGGHVTPALAIADAFKERYPRCDILFIGRSGGDENRAVEKAKYKIQTLSVVGFQRKITLKNLKSAYLALKAEKEAMKIIKQYSPDVVIGTGGYVCWPVIHAAQRLKIPTAIHESNLYPGLVTKLLSKGCDKVLLNYEDSKSYLKRQDNVCVVGNPVSSKLFTIRRNEARAKLGIREDEIYVLSFGGSGGSQILNETVERVMQVYCSKEPNIKHLHACGRRYYEKYKDCQASFSGCEIREYIDDMPYHLKSADVVICRCGAMTLSEICACGACAILIPSPNVTDNHQYKNGKYFADRSAALMIEEKNLTPDALISAIKRLASSPTEREALSSRIKKLGNAQSSKNIVKEMLKIIRKNGD